MKEHVDALNYLVSRGQATSEKDNQVINTFKDDMGHLNEYYKFEAMNKNFEAPIEQEPLIYLTPAAAEAATAAAAAEAAAAAAAAAATMETTPTDHTRSRNRSKSAKRSTKGDLTMDERSFRSTSLDTSQVFLLYNNTYLRQDTNYNDDI